MPHLGGPTTATTKHQENTNLCQAKTRTKVIWQKVELLPVCICQVAA